MSTRPLDLLPQVHELLSRARLEALSRSHGRTVVAQAARKALQRIRDDFREGTDPLESVQNIEAIIELDVASPSAGFRRTINATGVLLHTGLGRSPLAAEALASAAEIARGYCNLEIDLETGERGRRSTGVEQLLVSLTGAEAAEVVNNNAAATVLAHPGARQGQGGRRLARGIGRDRRPISLAGDFRSLRGGASRSRNDQPHPHRRLSERRWTQHRRDHARSPQQLSHYWICGIDASRATRRARRSLRLEGRRRRRLRRLGPPQAHDLEQRTNVFELDRRGRRSRACFRRQIAWRASMRHSRGQARSRRADPPRPFDAGVSIGQTRSIGTRSHTFVGSRRDDRQGADPNLEVHWQNRRRTSSSSRVHRRKAVWGDEAQRRRNGLGVVYRGRQRSTGGSRKLGHCRQASHFQRVAADPKRPLPPPCGWPGPRSSHGFAISRSCSTSALWNRRTTRRSLGRLFALRNRDVRKANAQFSPVHRRT